MNFLWDFLHGVVRKIYSYFIPTRHNAYRPRLLQTSWLLFFLALILTAEGVLLANVFTNQSARDFLAAVLPSKVVELTNLERGFNNVATLKENTTLARAAEAKARDMAKKGYFAHVGPDGKEPWAWLREAGYSYSSAGENLAVRFNESADVVNAWMASPTHRANIVKRAYTEIGVGTAQGMYKGSPATFVVQYFGKPTAKTSATTETSGPLAVEALSPEVLGAAAESAAKMDVAEAVASVGMAPTVQAFAVLTGVAIFLLVVVFLTFAIHVQVQPVDLLLGGGGVAAIAVTFVALNFFSFGPVIETAQTASVIGSVQEDILVGEGASVDTEEIKEIPEALPTEEAAADEGIEDLPEESVESTLTL